jgi:hypothetical protein
MICRGTFQTQDVSGIVPVSPLSNKLIICSRGSKPKESGTVPSNLFSLMFRSSSRVSFSIYESWQRSREVIYVRPQNIETSLV